MTVVVVLYFVKVVEVSKEIRERISQGYEVVIGVHK